MVGEVPVLLILSLLTLVALISFESQKPALLVGLCRWLARPVGWLFTRQRLLALGALLCIAGLACGGVCWWYQTRGSIHESHTIGEYRFKITSERDSEHEVYEGSVLDDVYISVFGPGTRVERVSLGYIIDPTEPLTFTVRQLPNESLVVVMPNDREAIVVFAYDTATGACSSQPNREDWREHYEAEQKLHAAFEARIRACPGCEQYALGYLAGKR